MAVCKAKTIGHSGKQHKHVTDTNQASRFYTSSSEDRFYTQCPFQAAYGYKNQLCNQVVLF